MGNSEEPKPASKVRPRIILPLWDDVSKKKERGEELNIVERYVWDNEPIGIAESSWRRATENLFNSFPVFAPQTIDLAIESLQYVYGSLLAEYKTAVDLQGAIADPLERQAFLTGLREKIDKIREALMDLTGVEHEKLALT